MGSTSLSVFRVGDRVVCIDPLPARIQGTDLREGQTYLVQDVRLYDFSRPGDGLPVDEIKIIPGPTRYDRVGGGWWFAADRFRLTNKEDTGVKEEESTLTVAETVSSPLTESDPEAPADGYPPVGPDDADSGPDSGPSPRSEG